MLCGKNLDGVCETISCRFENNRPIFPIEKGGETISQFKVVVIVIQSEFNKI